MEPNDVAVPWAGVEPNKVVDPIADELGAPKREEVPDPNAGVDDPKMDVVGADVDPKGDDVVVLPNGEELNAGVDVVPKPVAPKPAGFGANGFDCTLDEKGFEAVCPKVDEEPKGLDCGADAPKPIPTADWPAGLGPPEYKALRKKQHQYLAGKMKEQQSQPGSTS